MPGFLEAIRESVGPTLFDYGVSPLLKIFFVLFLLVLPIIAYLSLAERKIIGFIQSRNGPNRVGPWGVLQPIADGMKLLIKEDVVPEKAVKWAFILAPCLVVVPTFVLFSVIPFGPAGESLNYFVTDLNVGALFIVAVATLSVYGIVIGGWASNSKFSLIGGLRSAAQMVSYEVPQGLAIVGVLMLAGSMSLVDIVEAQRSSHLWYFIPQILGFFVFLVAGVAESNRSPFDLPEAESELVAGFHTESTGMRLALLLFIPEYGNMVLISGFGTTLFFGGWLRPFPSIEALAFLDGAWLPLGLSAVVPVVWFLLKLSVFLFVYIWFRGTFPRYRFDRLMELAWKWLLPLALVNVFVTGLVKLIV